MGEKANKLFHEWTWLSAVNLIFPQKRNLEEFLRLVMLLLKITRFFITVYKNMLTEKLYSPIVKFKFYFGAITENKVTGKKSLLL